MTTGEDDNRALEEENDDDGSVDDGEAEAEEEAALVLGEVEVARDDEGADEELSSVADGCEEKEGEGEENGCCEDACVAAADCEGVGLDSEAGSDVVALAWGSARRSWITLLLGRGNGESWTWVSRVRVSRLLWEPNRTVKEIMQRATSEKTVMMRVGLIIEAGIVRIRFSLFFVLFTWRPWAKGTERKGCESLSGLSTRAFITSVN
jgi:hypothetical protein